MSNPGKPDGGETQWTYQVVWLVNGPKRWGVVAVGLLNTNLASVHRTKKLAEIALKRRLKNGQR